MNLDALNKARMTATELVFVLSQLRGARGEGFRVFADYIERAEKDRGQTPAALQDQIKDLEEVIAEQNQTIGRLTKELEGTEEWAV